MWCVTNFMERSAKLVMEMDGSVISHWYIYLLVCQRMPYTTICPFEVYVSKSDRYKLTRSFGFVDPSYESILGFFQLRGKGSRRRSGWNGAIFDWKKSFTLPMICSSASLRWTSSTILSNKAVSNPIFETGGGLVPQEFDSPLDWYPWSSGLSLVSY